MTIGLTDLSPQEISSQLGLEPFQARQLFRWIHQKRVFDFDLMTDLSKELRRHLADTCVAAQIRLEDQRTSKDSCARKAIFSLADGETVESVLLRDQARTTICLSTQVGCPIKCPFCATGRAGFVRNLSAGEIVEQALHLISDEDLLGRTPNIVYMGMGEPFRNYDAVVQSIRLLMAREGLGIGARKITVSTVGEVPGVRRFAHEGWQVRLSISLHAANDKLRSKLVPLNRAYPIADLMAAVNYYFEITGRQVTFEWVLIAGVNDTSGDAEQLAGLIRGLDAAVNLIPYNPVADAEYASPTQEQCELFRKTLAREGIKVTLRKTLGADIDAACGQLRQRRLAEASAE